MYLSIKGITGWFKKIILYRRQTKLLLTIWNHCNSRVGTESLTLNILSKLFIFNYISIYIEKENLINVLNVNQFASIFIKYQLNFISKGKSGVEK